MAAVEQGLVIGVGGTNFRVATARHDDIESFDSVHTSTEPAQFFGNVGRHILDASDAGSHWVVVGFPGPVVATVDENGCPDTSGLDHSQISKASTTNPIC